MLSRALLLFSSQLRGESRRVDTLVILLLYAGFALSILSHIKEEDPRIAGLLLLRAMTVVHAAMAVLLAVRLAGDVAGSRVLGETSLLWLSGLSAESAIVSQLLLAGSTFLRVWLVHVPILCLACHLGGTSWQQILQIEALLLGGFVMTLCCGLPWMSRATARGSAPVIGIVPVLVELVVWLPAGVIFALQSWTTVSVPQTVITDVERLRYLSAISCVRELMQTPWASPILLTPLIVQLGTSLLSLWFWKRTYFTRLDEGDVPAVAERTSYKFWRSKPTTRPSRPVWDDALAWQAYYVHNNGRVQIIVRSVFVLGWAVFSIGYLCSDQNPFTDFLITMSFILTFCLIFISHSLGGAYFLNELKLQTLTTLMLTPYRYLDLYDGWMRGVRKMMWPDLCLLAMSLGIALWCSPMKLAPAYAGFAVILLCSGPFIVLSPLVPFTLRGLGTGVGLVMALIGMAGALLALSVFFHPWLGPLLAIPLGLGWHQLGRRIIPIWFAHKQEATA
ncbi:MAG: hypothetical protein U0929_05875 [Planctomycetaceae bacterium]